MNVEITEIIFRKKLSFYQKSITLKQGVYELNETQK